MNVTADTNLGFLGVKVTNATATMNAAISVGLHDPASDNPASPGKITTNELVLGNVYEESRQEYIRIMDRLVKAGAEGIILGCTEIELLVRAGDSQVPLFPTTRIHAEAAVEYALR